MADAMDDIAMDDMTVESLTERIVALEWDQFQRTENEGGRASCQGNWPVFRQMRSSQFLTWPLDLLVSYRDDLVEADRVGRNLVTEKYARMMASTAPDEYRERIEPYIPRLSLYQQHEKGLIQISSAISQNM